MDNTYNLDPIKEKMIDAFWAQFMKTDGFRKGLIRDHEKWLWEELIKPEIISTSDVMYEKGKLDQQLIDKSNDR